MNESDYKKIVLRTYRMRQEIQYVSRRTLVLMFMMWGTFAAAGGSLIVCVNCAGVDEQTSNTLFLSGIVIFAFTSIVYFILGKEMEKTKVRRDKIE